MFENIRILTVSYRQLETMSLGAIFRNIHPKPGLPCYVGKKSVLYVWYGINYIGILLCTCKILEFFSFEFTFFPKIILSCSFEFDMQSSILGLQFDRIAKIDRHLFVRMFSKSMRAELRIEIPPRSIFVSWGQGNKFHKIYCI